MVSIIGTWYITGDRETAIKALAELARRVEAEEPGTIFYRIHTVDGESSLPPSSSSTVVFYEGYKDQAAFEAHINGPPFTEFMKDYGKLFVQSPGGGVYFTLERVERFAGFERG